MQLLNNLYAYTWKGQDNNCNSYLISNCLDQERHLLIDPGYIKTQETDEPALEKLLQGIQGDGVDPYGIELIILTHCHPDHVESAVFFQSRLKTKIAIHHAEAEIYGQMGGTADLILDDGDLKLGRKNPDLFQVLHTPGHSPGHIALYWPAEKTLVAGDLVFYHSTGRTDLPGGNKVELKQSIERVASLDLEWVLCGHPYGHSGIIQGKDAITENFRFIAQDLIG